MAKVKKTDINAKDIKEFLETHDDFALELFVLNKAHTYRFDAIHGGFYTDPITQKPRQYDVRATIGLRQRRIALAIECKSLKKSYPLLLSRLKRTKEESYLQYIVSARIQALRDANPSVPAEIITLQEYKSIYRVGEYVGKSTVQIGKKNQNEFVFGDNEVYDKWTQALNSAEDIISTSFPRFHSAEISIHTAIIPILVVPDETLWVVDYTDDGAMLGEPVQVDEAFYYIDREYQSPIGQPFKISHLHFYTKKGICALFENIANRDNEGYWNKLFYF